MVGRVGAQNSYRTRLLHIFPESYRGPWDVRGSLLGSSPLRRDRLVREIVNYQLSSLDSDSKSGDLEGFGVRGVDSSPVLCLWAHPEHPNLLTKVFTEQSDVRTFRDSRTRTEGFSLCIVTVCDYTF